MNDIRKPTDKMVLQILSLIIACVLVLCAFKFVDRAHERIIKVKLAELGLECQKEKCHD